MSKKDPCKKFACLIQKCLEENNFQASVCKEAIDNLTNCCRKWTKKNSLVCDGINIDESPSKKN